MWSNSEVSYPEKLVHIGVGLASPLWPAFYAAAMTGLTVWSFGAMARATRSVAIPGATLPVTAPARVAPVARASRKAGADGPAPRPRPARARKSVTTPEADPAS
jgi:hypothetical protein